jgi:hypothetical protein
MEEVSLVLNSLREHGPKNSDMIVLRPRDFFIAFGGVLCVVFEGFPRCVEHLKTRLEKEAPSMIRENPGSLWAKTTIGAIGGADHPPCHDAWLRLNELCGSFRGSIRSTLVLVPSITAVRFSNRGLSAGECLCSVPSSCVLAAFPEKALELSDGMMKKTLSVLHEAEEDPVAYFSSSLARGPTLMSHYTSFADGDTLVMPLHESFLMSPTCNEPSVNAEFFEVLRAFQLAAEAVVPSLQWLHLTSLHCTVRGIR